jgi:hypothetical protein
VEFLVGFDVNVPDGAARPEVEERLSYEAAAAAKLGVFIAIGGRRPGGVIYESHLVG